MLFTVTHNENHLLDFVSEVSLTDPLQDATDDCDWLDYKETREVAFLVTVAQIHEEIFDAPRCRKYSKVYHRVRISQDPDNKLGSLTRLDEDTSDCCCPLLLFQPDEEHDICIRRALRDLEDRYAREAQDIVDKNESKTSVKNKTTSGVDEPPAVRSTLKTNRKRSREDSVNDDEEIPLAKKARNDKTDSTNNKLPVEVIDLTQDDE
ncbi:hypothetical protein K435DRAFT_798715 [Dendrothele bispora CBS 962.96]|uniref:Uncharacterized protein n=1 Tax=Dendrothele bispora (strain CBS 962.96) TaxID=1314807 RepID=A0A4S8LYL2_DENBC|nr:hypothetical protein K435DRAFT_798715 [Dendrothele bispora CBS 962.96]